MQNHRHGDEGGRVVNFVHDPIVPNTDAVDILPRQLAGSLRAGIIRKAADLGPNSLLNLAR